MNGRERAIEILMEMSESTSAEDMLDYLIVNYLSGSQAYEAMKSMKEEFYGEDEEEDEDQNLEVGMEVEVVDENCSECVLEYQDVGIITEVEEENGIQYFRVEVDGRQKAGNWMRASQLARINY